MKKIMTILMFAAIFGLLICSVSATEWVEHDFDGHFTLKVPGNYWMAVGSGGHQYENDKGINIQHYTIDDINGATFAEYISSLGLKDGKTDGDLTVFQNDGKYVIVANSSDELYIITDKDLNEAKAIAESADLEVTETTPSEDNTTAESSNTTAATGDLEKVQVNDYLNIDAPKGSEFDNGTYDGYWLVYYAPGCDAAVYYTNDDSAKTKIDDAYYNEFIKNVTSQEGVKSSEIDNVTVVEGIQNIDGTNAAYVHGDNAMVIVVSNDLNLVKDMAQSVEFK